MKKQLRKPEHWQDFEGLCKKLWGEIWQVSNKIKKNGRLGQPQSGVDIYAIPKGEQNYWGVQCKGKDEYIDAKLTKKEIELEIEKARTFNPKLDVFIIATTTNKDVGIEEYVRNKDIESRQSGGFEILLYSWEDIVDLIEENRETFNYYVNQQQYKETHNFKATFNDFKTEIILEPICLRTIRRYVLKQKIEDIFPNVYFNPNLYDNKQIPTFNSVYVYLKQGSSHSKRSAYDNRNYALCNFEIIMSNEGSKVIEDWKVTVEFEQGSYTKITDTRGGLESLVTMKYKRTYCENNQIIYRPLEDKPLVQKDNRCFTAWIEPLPKEYEIKVFWSIIARDYNDKGELKIIVKPIYEDSYVYTEVDNLAEIKEDEIEEIKVKKYYPKEDKDDDTTMNSVF